MLLLDSVAGRPPAFPGCKAPGREAAAGLLVGNWFVGCWMLIEGGRVDEYSGGCCTLFAAPWLLGGGI